MTKIISLTNEVYEKLKKLKKGKSFSEEIEGLIEKTTTKGDVKSLEKFLGAWGKEEAAGYLKEVAATRKKFGYGRFA